jgi:hypothetical protein
MIAGPISYLDDHNTLASTATPRVWKNDNFQISPINHANHANLIELISYNTAIYSVW